MACGLPVITTACNGASELMTDGQEGFILTAPTAQAELIQALDRMADDRVRKPMAVDAAVLAQKQTFDSHVARLIKVFEEVAAAKDRRGPHLLKRAKRGVVL
jgi:UDP-glucose:(heptosyl)LPS alpha-1,3-glucosyltransferase